MRWRERASGGAFARSLRSLWRQPHLAVPAALSALWLLAMPAYLAVTFYGAALASPEGFIVDYSWFREAALRLFSDPATLYADPEYFYPPPAALLFWPTTWVSAVTGYILSGPLLFAGLAVAFAWALRLWERETGETLGLATRLALLVVALGSAPTFQNLKYAQVNVLVLLSALAFLDALPAPEAGLGRARRSREASGSSSCLWRCCRSRSGGCARRRRAAGGASRRAWSRDGSRCRWRCCRSCRGRSTASTRSCASPPSPA